MDFEPYFKVHNLVSVQPKSIILGQMTNLNMIFHVVVSVYRLVKIRNSPQFPDEFRNGLISMFINTTEKRFKLTDIISYISVNESARRLIKFVCSFRKCHSVYSNI